MAEKIGKLIICDLCGASEFLRHVRTNVHNGGFTHVDVYESPPDGWEYSTDLRAKLCPNCSAAWEKCKEDYLNRYKIVQYIKE